MSNASFQPGQPGDVPRSFNAVDDEEYSTYRARIPINRDGSRIFNPGDVVPKSMVDDGRIPADYVVAWHEQAAPLGHPRVADGTTSNTVANVSTDDLTPEVNPLELGAGYTATSTGVEQPSNAEPGGTLPNSDSGSSGGAASGADAEASKRESKPSASKSSSANK